MRKEPAYIIYEDDLVISFLDTLPIRPGHLLIIPKAHFKSLTDLPPELSAAIGQALTKVGHALTKGMENPNLNVVCNQGYAQAVYHVHFHLVPAPVFGAETVPEEPKSTTPTYDAITILEREQREELDDDDAKIIVEKIRSKL